MCEKASLWRRRSNKKDNHKEKEGNEEEEGRAGVDEQEVKVIIA